MQLEIFFEIEKIVINYLIQVITLFEIKIHRIYLSKFYAFTIYNTNINIS